MTSGPSAIAAGLMVAPGTSMKPPEGVLTLAPVLNAMWSDVPESLAPMAPTTRTPAIAAAAANTAINFDFLDIERLLVRGPPILPLAAGRLKRARPPFRRGATLLGAVRRIALLSLAVLALAVLAGCGAAGNQTQEQTLT